MELMASIPWRDIIIFALGCVWSFFLLTMMVIHVAGKKENQDGKK